MPGPYKPKPSGMRPNGRKPDPHQMMKSDENELRINEQITAPEVRLVGDNIPEQGIWPLQKALRLADELKVDLVLTSGGTGFSLRDRTPEATMAVADRNAPGIAEYIRMCSARITDRAMLSRGVSVIRKGTLIINLPGSPKAVRESLGFILHGLDHGLRILRGSASECAAK